MNKVEHPVLCFIIKKMMRTSENEYGRINGTDVSMRRHVKAYSLVLDLGQAGHS